MRFSAIVLLLSCWPLQPIHAALPEPAPPLKLILRDASCSVVHIAHGSYGTSLLLQKPGDLGVGSCTLNVRRGGRSVDYDLPVPGDQRPEERFRYPRDPYWQQVLCLGKEGTCLVAGKTLRDLVFVPAENAAADFPNLVPLVRQAWVIGEKNNYFLSFAWTNKARDRLLLLVRQQAFEDSMDRKDVLCYLAKGKQPWVIADETVHISPDVDLSARALFLKDGSGVFLSRDGKRLICFPAGQDAGYSLPLPGLCKGMSRQEDQQVRLLMQHERSIFARPLKLTGARVALRGGEKIADLPEAVSLATPLGEDYWVYPTDKRELLLWSEKEGLAAAPLVSDMYAGDLQCHDSWWQVADDGDGHRRILYCLAAPTKRQRVIGAIDAPPATLYQETKKLKKAPLFFPVRGLCGTVGFYVAETKTDGTFYPSPTDGSFFSLENGVSASIPLPNDYTPEQIKQVTCWFCPEQKLWQLYLALVTDNDHFKLYGLSGNAQERFSHKKRGGSQPKFRFGKPHSYKNMQWVVNQETNSPVLVLLPHSRSYLQTVRGFSARLELSEETDLPLFTFLGDGNLAARTTEDRIHVYRLSMTRDEEMGEKLAATWLFNCLPGLTHPRVSMLLSIQERGIERVLLRTGGQMYCTNFLFKESGETCTLDTEKIEDGHFLLPPAFAAHYIGNRAIGHTSDTGGRPCVIIADDQGELSLLHVGSTKVVVTGFLRRLLVRVEDLVPDMINLLVSFSRGVLLPFQERTSYRQGLFTWSSHFDRPASATPVGKEVKCRALVRFQQ